MAFCADRGQRSKASTIARSQTGSASMKKFFLSSVVLTSLVLSGGSAFADIVIGVAGPITGPNAAFGAQFVKGAEQAAANINAAGGVLGEQVKIVIGDDVSDPKQGISVANKFVADGVHYVVGHFNSGVSIPASEVYAENGVLQITPASTNPQFTERSLWNTFRTCGRDDQQGRVAAAYIAANFKDAKIAIVHDKTPYGQGLVDVAKQELNGAGITEVLYEGITGGEKDFSALIAKMKAAGVTLIYFGGLHTEAGLIMRQSADQGLKATLFSGDGMVSSELAQIAGDAVVGTLNTFAPDPRRNPAAKDVVEAFRTAGFEPEAYTLYSYIAVQIIASAIEKTGSAEDAQKVAETIKSGGPWATALGEIGYDAKGDINRPDYVIYEWRKGEDGKPTYFEK
jgi:branched-chain amino acid transport system substrate-binding protein